MKNHPSQTTTHTPKHDLRAAIAVVLTILTTTTATTAQNTPPDTSKYSILAGLTLIDHSHAPFLGIATTHTNGFSSIVTIEFKATLSAARYNSALTLTKKAPLTIAALFGPQIEAPQGDLFGPDKITYLTLASGAAITYHTHEGPNFSLAALYNTPDKSDQSLNVLFAISYPL